MQVAHTTQTNITPNSASQNSLLDSMLINEIYAPMVVKQSAKNLTQNPSLFVREQQYHMHRFLEAHCDCV